MVLLSVRFLQSYGWALFVALPFTMGFAAALIYSARQPRSLHSCVGVACLAVAILGMALLALAMEGILCLVMAMPIALPVASVGAICGYLLQPRRFLRQRTPAVFSLLLTFVPGVQWIEHLAAPAPVIYEVRTAIDIQAPSFLS